MRTLSIGVFAEGPTDPDFLIPLLGRFTHQVISARGRHPIFVSDPVDLPGRPSAETFRETTSRYWHSVDILVVHTDANGDSKRARTDRIDPWFASVRDIFDGKERSLVAIVPARETEAWMLCDVAALTEVLGTTTRSVADAVPTHVHEVEHLQEPKEVLRELRARVLGRRRAKKVGLRPLYAALGLRVSFDRLNAVPAFQEFASDFVDALARLGYVQP